MLPLPYPFIDEVNEQLSALQLRRQTAREPRRRPRARRWRRAVRGLAAIAMRERGNPRGVPDV